MYSNELREIIADFTNVYIDATGFDISNLAELYDKGQRFLVWHKISTDTLDIFLKSKDVIIPIARMGIFDYLKDRDTFVLDIWRYISIANRVIWCIDPCCDQCQSEILEVVKNIERELKEFISQEKR